MPAAVAAVDLEATIAAELAAHRPVLEQLVRERVRLALAELTRELVVAELAAGSASAKRSNGGGLEHEPEPELPESTAKSCSACRELLPLDRFPVDSRRRDDLRSRCRTCEAQRQRELRQRHRAQQEVEPVPFAGTQSTTSHESTAVAT